MLFGRYRKVVYLAQVDSSELLHQAERAATQLKLPLEVVSRVTACWLKQLKKKLSVSSPNVL